jgi:hypothetical protein
VVLGSRRDLPSAGPVSRGPSLMSSYQENLTRRSLESASPLVCVARTASKQADVAGPIQVGQDTSSSSVLSQAGEQQSDGRNLYVLDLYSFILVFSDQVL